MAYPTDPLSVVVELWNGTTWVDITSDVYSRGAGSITINQGFPNEGTTPEPSSCSFQLRNIKFLADGTVDWAGRYSPRNPNSIYYGLIGRNTPIRVSVTGYGVLFVGEVSEWPSRWDVSGRDVWVDITAQGILRRLGQGQKPALSPYTSSARRILNLGTPDNSYWPMEDAGGTSWASFTPGGPPMTYAGGAPDFAASGPILGSDSLPILAATTSLRGRSLLTRSHGNQNAFATISVPTSPGWVDGTPIVRVDQAQSGSTVAAWQVRYRTGSGGSVDYQALDAAGVALGTSATFAYGIEGKDLYLRLLLRQVGADVQMTLFRSETGGGASGNVGTFAGVTHTYITEIYFAPAGGLPGLVVGQVFIGGEDPGGSVPQTAEASVSFAGETAADRAVRLADEQGITVTVVGDPAETMPMGAQAIPSTFADAFAETHSADLALVSETRDALELTWRSRRSLYNQASALDLDYEGAGEVAPDLEPTNDDQHLRNDVEVKQKDGTSARATKETGTNSIAAVGRYDTQRTLNLYNDADLFQIASWIAGVGTWDEERYPLIRINMAAAASNGKTSLMADVVALEFGDRIRILNPPDWLPPGPIDLMVLGRRIEFEHPIGWVYDLNCVPYGPYGVQVWADNAPDTADTVGRWASSPQAAIRAAINTSTTSIAFDPRFRWTTTASHFDTDDYPAMQAQLLPSTAAPTSGGELVTVSAISTTAATFVAAGTVAHANNANVTPTLPAGGQANDLLLIFAAIRNSGAGVPQAPSGYSRLPIFDVGDNCQVFAKVHSGSESNPTVTFTGGVANADTSAQMCAFRNMPVTGDLTDLVLHAEPMLNASGQNIAVPGLTLLRWPGSVVLAFGWKQDDWTSVLPPFGTEIGEPDTTTGDDQGITWAYVIQTTAAEIVPGQSFAVTGGGNAISRSAIAVLAGGFQTATVIRSTNGITKAHAAGTSIAVERPQRYSL